MTATKYHRRAKAAAQALADGLSRQEAATAAGVDPSTVFRWMQRGDFQAAIEEAKAGKLQRAPQRRRRWRDDPELEAAEVAFWAHVAKLVPAQAEQCEARDPRVCGILELFPHRDDPEFLRLLAARDKATRQAYERARATTE